MFRMILEDIMNTCEEIGLPRGFGAVIFYGFWVSLGVLLGLAT